MKAAYRLADDAAKSLIGMKVRKKAFEGIKPRDDV